MSRPALHRPRKTLSRNRLPDGLGACLLLTTLGLVSLLGTRFMHNQPTAYQVLEALGWILSGLGTVGALALWPRINRSLHSMELAMAGSHDGMFEWDPLTKRLIVGRRLLDILGYTNDFLPTSD
ncbi:MAG: hypothetical protein K2W33_12445, partial [Burkholderiales bacterium]|nr:hypothetical protein [Burkholderiales bacterium]